MQQVLTQEHNAITGTPNRELNDLMGMSNGYGVGHVYKGREII